MKKILIVEDNDTVRNNLIDILRINKYQTISAENGLEGFHAALEQMPDLILSDIMMPVMDGYEFLKKVRETSPINFTPFIFLSAKSTYKDVRYGMNLSADDYLSKPFSVAELVNAIESNLSKAKKMDAKVEQLKDSIAFSIPHELRTPLAAILGFTGLLKDIIQSDADKNEIMLMADNIYDSGIRLNNVINKFILYSESSLVLVDPAMIKKYNDSEIESTDAYIKPSAEKTCNKLGRIADLKIEINNFSVRMDNRHLVYIVEELIENACKYSQPNSEIEISSKKENDFWTVSVLDHGIGMDAHQIKSVGVLNQFDRKIHEVAGNGLGLSTLQKIIEIYSGELIINSEPQFFTNVTVKFPIR